jgi:hypothetical protein
MMIAGEWFSHAPSEPGEYLVRFTEGTKPILVEVVQIEGELCVDGGPISGLQASFKPHWMRLVRMKAFVQSPPTPLPIVVDTEPGEAVLAQAAMRFMSGRCKRLVWPTGDIDYTIDGVTVVQVRKTKQNWQ